MRILFLSRWFPFPVTNGSKLRIHNLLRGLSVHHDITLLSFVDEPDTDPERVEIGNLCSDVHVVPWQEFDPGSTKARWGLFRQTPRSIIDTFSPAMAQTILELCKMRQFDLVIASQLSMASYRSYFRAIPAIFEEVEIGLAHDRIHEANPIMQLRHTLTWLKLRAYLSRLLNSYQSCTVASQQELKLLTGNFSVRNMLLEVIPNCVDVRQYEHIESTVAPNQLIFSGSFRYRPNYEAMIWYAENVHPYILREIPDVHVLVTGDHANLPFPSIRNITLTGHVQDIRPLIASSSASIAPLRSGGGTRLKILEAMALGTPVVSTEKGMEGLMAKSGEHLLIADQPHQFAESVIRLLRDKEFSRRIVTNARILVRDHYDWKAAMPKFLKLVNQVVAG